MKLGLAFSQDLMTPDNFRFARQAGCTHVFAALQKYSVRTFPPATPGGAEQRIAFCEPDEAAWTYDGPAADPAGETLFQENCAECHRADGTTAGLVPVEEIGTDPTVALAPGRGTGFYRVPSLWGIADRRQLMHDGKLESLEAMFDPARLDEVPGHEQGLELSASDRKALLSFVRWIGASGE